ncbi:MAG TPA: flagellar hook-length control protein FliK [Rhodocyclaceae bacterium]|nr:flagellar hook-length control protein FliK [Rhodocyclaceae bacterium]
MIPANLASRLRVLVDSEVKAPAPIQALRADFAELELGQRFSAVIESSLPDGSFRALVAGRNLTLLMPEGARNGDALELIVTGKQDRTITARLADPAVAPTSTAHAKLSPAGQLISQLLTGRHADTRAAPLNRNEPLLTSPPDKGGSSLTPLLRQAVSESGLFYEAHQAQWAEGEGSLESLLREPQGRLSMTLARALTGSATVQGALPSGADTPSDLLEATPDSMTHLEGTRSAAMSAQGVSQGQAQGQDMSAVADPDTGTRATLPPGHEANVQREAADKSPGTNTSALKIAEQLMPLVHQQLEALATHQALWQGQVWPGQHMQWEIVDPEGEPHSSGDQGGGSESPPWQSIMRLKMPRLGDIEAQLIVTAAGVAVRISVDSTRTAAQLREGGEALGNALEAAGVPMTGFVVQSGDAREARP